MTSPHLSLRIGKNMDIPPFKFAILKLASRCNLDCTYCYWFRDENVYKHPKLLSQQVQTAFLSRLEEHMERYNLERFNIVFHGGEPLLFGKARLIKLLYEVHVLEKKIGRRISCGITTNAVLIDDEWAEIFKAFNVGPSISIDGPKEVHDAYRIDHKGRGSYDRTVKGMKILEKHGIDFGILAVCDPKADPKQLLHVFVNELGLNRFDVLIPDANYDNKVESIAPYYQGLLEEWYKNYVDKGIKIRIINAMLQGMFEGGDPGLDSMGYGALSTLVVLTDGKIEPNDVLRISGSDATTTDMSVFSNSLQDVTQDLVWQNAYKSSLQLSEVCQQCEYKTLCGGGHLAHRWSRERGYDNPSVYCDDYQSIYKHMWQLVAPNILIKSEQKVISLYDFEKQHRNTLNVKND